MTARERRQVVEQVQAVREVSERRAIRYTGFPRSTMRYRSTRDPQELLRARIVELAQERPRWGYRMIHVMLRREGRLVNRKRVQRLYREEGLAVRSKGRKRRSQAPRPIREALSGPNERWSMDFVSDTLSNGRQFRCLTIMDEFSRECLAIHIAHSIPAAGVIEVMECLKESRGLPEVIITDNGSEFRSRAFDSWAYARGVKLDFIGDSALDAIGWGCYYSCRESLTPFLTAVSATRSSSFFSRLPKTFSAIFTSSISTFGSFCFFLGV